MSRMRSPAASLLLALFVLATFKATTMAFSTTRPLLGSSVSSSSAVLTTTTWKRRPPAVYTTAALQAKRRRSDRSGEESEDSLEKNSKSHRFFSLRPLFHLLPSRRMLQRVLLVFAVSVAATTKAAPPACAANAPVMAMPKSEMADPESQAMAMQKEKDQRATQQELNRVAQQAREIQEKDGVQARVQFERDYQAQQVQQQQDKADGLVALQRELLDQGICPFCDVEGQRAVTEYKTGVNLGQVAGTQYQLESVLNARNSPKAYKVRKQANRQIIQFMVQDMKTHRHVDPLEYFQRHTDQTRAILDMKPEQAEALVQQYQRNLEQYGQITAPKPGEVSAKERLERQQNDPAFMKQEKKRLQQEAKEKAAAKRALQKQQAQERKAAEKEARKLAKQQKQKSTMASSGAAVIGASASTTTTFNDMGGSSSSTGTTDLFGDQMNYNDGESNGLLLDNHLQSSSPTTASSSPSIMSKAIVPGGVAVVGGGGGFLLLKQWRDKAARAEEEQQMRLRQMMQPMFEADDDDDEEEDTYLDDVLGSGFKDDDDEEDLTTFKKQEEPLMDDFSMPELIKKPKKKKKRLGIFTKKSKSTRETDITKVVLDENSTSSQFSMVLAKILSFGAPKVFGAIQSLPGGMPMETYDMEDAQRLLDMQKGDSDLSDKDCAEAFAAVVNCMLIDVVDIAASLKAREDIIAAADVVVDFMNQAASLFVSVAGDINMDPPVTYGGTLGKRKLEKLYEVYASQMMEKMTDESFTGRLDLLKDVFEISDGKAQGAAMKSMMQMMKDPKKVEEMQKMMEDSGMGDLMKGMGEQGALDPSMMDKFDDPQQLLEMLRVFKTMVDAGEIGPSEMAMMKTQFKEQFGESIEEVLQKVESGTDEMSDSERELAEIIKSLMEA